MQADTVASASTIDEEVVAEVRHSPPPSSVL